MYRIMHMIQEYLTQDVTKEYIMTLSSAELGYIEFTPNKIFYTGSFSFS